MNSETTADCPIVLAMTGASGAIYAVRLLHSLVRARIPVHLVLSPAATEVLVQELPSLNRDRLKANALGELLQFHWDQSKNWTSLSDSDLEFASSSVQQFDHQSYMAPIASGSFLTRGMVVCPCSGSTLSGIVHAASNNLIVRAADVHLKERRKLILVNRETPLSVFQLENMHRAAQAGAVMLPAMPGWYHGVTDLLHLVDFIVARILDQLHISHQLMKRWGSEALTKESADIATARFSKTDGDVS